MENAVAEKTRQALTPVIERLGFEVVDVEYVKKSDGMNLTVYIYIPRGVTIDDCETVHNAVNPVIDELNPTDDKPYIFNISSPGLDRPFKTQRDFERNYGKEVEIKLYAPLRGKKFYEGVLVEKTENTVKISTPSGDENIELTRVVFVRPLVKFE
ncbi:ribosome maturation factor RimP [Pumilibacter muris]|uniref:ribosome maturation factor RimP n=1 Tax=Pumilibacter muris TaxID=2941510 RepID=UPI0020411322|nr:ribosome maturation factor RimP [Pumilibacter muris]